MKKFRQKIGLCLTQPFLFSLLIGLHYFLISNECLPAESAAPITSHTNPDTAIADNTTSELLYEIELMRAERLLLSADKSSKKKTDYEIALQLKTEATETARAADYELAYIILQEVTDLLVNIRNQKESTEITSRFINDFENFDDTSEPEALEWTREILIGSDIWRQEFEMTATEGDTTLLEGSQNPLLGILLGFDYENAEGTFFQGRTGIKKSRDYFVADGQFGARKALSEKSTLEFENRLEWTAYSEDDLKYFHNNFSAQVKSNLNSMTDMTIRCELMFRNYAREDDFYASYIQGYSQVAASRYFSNNLRISLGYSYLARNHTTAAEKDYRDHRGNTNLSKSFGASIRIYINNQIRYRNYLHAESDTAFQNDYFDDYMLANFKYSLNAKLSVELENILNYREYRHHNPMLPTYLQNSLKPAFSYQFNTAFSVNIGYVYAFTVHEDYSENAEAFVSNEDFNSSGPEIGMDVFTLNNFMMSFNYIYEMRRYPHSKTKAIEDFSLFSDRNIHSLLLFLSWEITDVINLGIIANYDNDKDKKQENSDSRSTMLSVELNVKF